MADNRHRRTATQLRRTAYHEAGHAVIYFVVRAPSRRGLCSATIVPAGKCAGRFANQMEGCHRLGTPRDVGLAKVLLAGKAASDVVMGNRPRLRLDPDHGEALEALFADAEHGQGASVWEDESAFYELLAAMATKRDREALRRLRNHVDELVKMNWPVITRVAEALLKENVLNNQRLRDLIEAHGDLVPEW